MEKQEQSTSCKHYLRLYSREATDTKPSTLWATCRNCKRHWFIGADVALVATGKAGDQ